MSLSISPRSRANEPSRRAAIVGAAAGLAAIGLPLRASAAGTTELSEFVARITEGAVPLREGVTLAIPPLVENGNSVDVRVVVESPMTEQNHVRWIHLIADKNPFPDMARLHLGPRAGRAEIATTLRLAQSQKVTAVAALSDGRFAMAQADVVVTLSACIDGG